MKASGMRAKASKSNNAPAFCLEFSHVSGILPHIYPCKWNCSGPGEDMEF